METKVVDNATMMADIDMLIREGKSVNLRVKGNSMNPFFATERDSMLLSPFTSDDIRKGAVILGKDSRGIFLIHRVFDVRETPDGKVITLLGDGNPVTMKETMLEKDVIARVTAYERRGRRGRMVTTAEGKASVAWVVYSWIWKVLLPVRRWPLGLWRHTHRSLLTTVKR